MEYLIIIVVSMLAVELFLKLPVRQSVEELLRVTKKSSHVVLSPHISDHWKEKVMLVYAKQAFSNTVKLTAVILIFASAIFLPLGIVDYLELTRQSLLELLSSLKGLLVTTISAACYLWLRGKIAQR